MKYTLSITHRATFDSAGAAADAIKGACSEPFTLEAAFIDCIDVAAPVSAPAPAPAPVTQGAETQPAPKPVKPKAAVKPAADPAPAPASDAEPAPAPAPAPASPAKTEVVTAGAVRAYLMPFFTADGGARKAEVNALIKTFGANLDAVAPKDLPKLLAAAKEKFDA